MIALALLIAAIVVIAWLAWSLRPRDPVEALNEELWRKRRDRG